jgi:glycosyltransferase involved in cell wall biosynthesis
MLVTHTTNMGDYVSGATAGLVCDPTAESIAKGLAELIDRRDELPQMGKNARALGKTEFEWGAISERLTQAVTIRLGSVSDE